MKLDPAMMARLQAATQQLMKNGPLAGTAAIQRALAGDDVEQDAPAGGSAQRASGATMKDLNAPPPQSGTARKPNTNARYGTAGTAQARQQSPEDDGGQSAARDDSAHSTAQDEGIQRPASMQAGLADLLAKAGIKLPENFKAPEGFRMPEGFKMPEGFTMPEGVKLPEGFKMPEGFKPPEGFDLPEALKNANLPGMKKRPPPPPLPDGARFDSASFTCHAGTRGYKLYVPSTYEAAKQAGKQAPLIVMLHGCTQDPDDFAAGTRMNTIAEETGALVVYPSQSQQANSSRCWNWFSPADQQHDRGEPAIIAGIAREVMKDYAVDPKQVSIAGLSAGGAMAVIVGSLYPDLFSAVGVHSGLPFGSASDLPSALQAMKQGSGKRRKAVRTPPLIVFHGDKDQTVHAKNGDDILCDGLASHSAAKPEVESAKANGGRKYTRAIHRCADGRLLAEHWTLHGGGHAWAGGSASGSYTDGTGPDASREMVRFFAAVAGNN